MEFKEWVKEERKKQDLSGQKLSEKLGRSRSYISQVERGLIKEITREMAMEIVDILGLDESVLNQFKFIEGSIKSSKDDLKELIDIYNGFQGPVDGCVKDNEKIIRGKLENDLDEHIELMSTSELAGLLIILKRERHILYELSTIPTYVKSDKVTHTIDMIGKYIEFMKQVYKKDKNNSEKPLDI